MATTPRLVEAAAAQWPDAEALVDGDVRLSFRELRDEVGRATRAAMAAGLRKGDRAAIWAPNMREWVIAALGLHGAGAVIVPLNTRYKGDEAAYVLNRSGARILFTVQGFLGIDYPAMLDGRETPIQRTVLFGSSSWDEYLSGATDADPPEVSEEDLSDIIFTSGTTGRPKGVMTTHGQTVQVFREWSSIVGLRAGDRYLIATPFFHTFGYKSGIVASLIAGATVFPLPVVEVQTVLELVSRERISMLPATPTLFQSIFNDPGRDRYDLSSLRLSAVGAASVPVELVERMRSELFSTVVTGYGLTESTGVISMSRPEDPPEIISRTVGRAIPGVDVRVVDKEGTEVPRGTAGEILARGFNVMRGYFDDPEQTAEVIDADGWLHTGDIGTMDEAGYLAITDRLKDMFIVGGFNAYPAEIEAALLRHPGIAMAAVIGIPDERLGEVGMAFVVPAQGTSLSEDGVISWARAEMANYKVPRRVAIVEALPTNAVGKVLKNELRAQARFDAPAANVSE
ncbi:MAG: AMP-binding protein [Acidimicrobiaceae bacterium]|nr:AMP-binding protein [Acidimicrobiaceae bacterium]